MREIIGLVAHDAGGAEVLASWAQYSCTGRYIGYVEGPAESIFLRAGIERVTSVETLINRSTKILTGTSWSSSLEKKVIRSCRQQNKVVCTMIDHWVNYRERFVLDGCLIMPNEIWTLDDHATAIASTLFGDVTIVQVPNVYLQKRIEKVKIIENSGVVNRCVLFIGENIEEHALCSYGNPNHFGYNEKSILENFIANYGKHISEETLLQIRPHPSQNNQHYAWTKDRMPGGVLISNENDLELDIARSQAVFGITSMALVIAALSGKRTYSCLPKHLNLDLPFKEILRL